MRRTIVWRRETSRAILFVGTLPAGAHETTATRTGWPRRLVRWIDGQIAAAIVSADRDRLAGKARPDRW